ncbi:MAG: hypothetical protein K2W95_18660 [Candidatus Obscuribacterales bacterium]|nr:hypothetical protein [Candidatus Obscuribacterales bacterium]
MRNQGIRLWYPAGPMVVSGCVIQLLCLLVLSLRFESLFPICAVLSLVSGAATSLYALYSLEERMTTIHERCSRSLEDRDDLPPLPPPPLSGADHFFDLDQAISGAATDRERLLHKDYALFENLAVETERNRITAEINCKIMPHFERMNELASHTANRELAVDVQNRLRTIEAGVQAVLDELHPRLLAQTGLVASVNTLVDRFRRASRIETIIVTAPDLEHIDISLEAKFAIYRATQEALNNIEKHSAASQARVVISFHNEALIVLIEDNGRGFQSGRTTQSRGLKNIRERAAAIGAEVQWQRSVAFERGTLVTIALNVDTAKAKAAKQYDMAVIG